MKFDISLCTFYRGARWLFKEGLILLKCQSKIIARKSNIICPVPIIYCVSTVNFTMLAFILEAFGSIRNTWTHATEDANGREPQSATEKLT